MDFTIPCETFARLSKIPMSLDHKDERLYLKTIRIEHIGGIALAIAMTNRLIAVENLGATKQPDGAVNIYATDALIAQCETEKAFNSNLLINVNPILKFASLKTMFGYNHPTNAALFMDDQREWARWRTILPATAPAASFGVMSWNADKVATLAACSPSGIMVFSEFVDIRQPVIVRDIHDDNWFGAFIPHIDNIEEPPAAQLPAWFKRS